jgi:hypothetical protein
MAGSSRVQWPQSVYNAYVQFGPRPRWLLKLIARPFVRVVPDDEMLPKKVAADDR